MPTKSPTARTLEELRRLGLVADVCERWLPYTRRRSDLLGCFDVVAVGRGSGVLGIQATTGSNAAARVRKLVGSDSLAVWLSCGNRAEVWGWRKTKADGWSVRRVRMYLEPSGAVAAGQAGQGGGRARAPR